METIITTQGLLKDIPENVLFNRMNVNALNGWKRLQLTFEPGKRHLMKFVNIGVDNFYKVGIDGHMMEVVAIDFRPVKPYTAQYVSLGIGSVWTRSSRLTTQSDITGFEQFQCPVLRTRTMEMESRIQ